MTTAEVIQSMINYNIRQRDIAAMRVDSEGALRRRINLADQGRYERAIDRLQGLLDRGWPYPPLMSIGR